MRVETVAQRNTGCAMTAQPPEIQYLVLPSASDPFLLARVRWPDVFQAMSPVRPDWQDDPGLFDLPYAPAGTRVTRDEAERIAAEWGARLPSEDEQPRSAVSLIRRMPSDWSNLSTAERRAWSIEEERRPTRSAADPVREGADANSARVPTRRRWGRRRLAAGFVEASALPATPIADQASGASRVVGLSEPGQAGGLLADLA